MRSTGWTPARDLLPLLDCNLVWQTRLGKSCQLHHGHRLGLQAAECVFCDTCRTSKDLKVEEEDLQPSSTETSISSAAGPHLKDGPGAPRQLIQELIEENSKLFEENKKLGARYPPGPAA